MEADIVIQNDIFNKNMNQAIGKYKLVFISSTIGSGKTVAVNSWLKETQRKYRKISFSNVDTFLLQIHKIAQSNDTMLYIIPDLHLLAGDRDCLEALKHTIAASENNLFFLITSRAPMPEQLQGFLVTKQAKLFNKDIVRFSLDMTKKYLASCKISVRDDEIEKIHLLTRGYPLLLDSLCNYLEQSPKLTEEMIFQARQALFCYLDTGILKRLSAEDTLFLMKLSVIKREERLFSRDALIAAVGTEEISGPIYRLLSVGRFLMEKEPGRFRIIYLFREYLQTRISQYLSIDEIRDIQIRLGNYFEKEEDIYNAVYYYKEAGNTDKVAQLLISNIKNKSVGAAQYYELAPYYLALPEKMILESAALTCGMSMLYSLLCEVKKSEFYFAHLEEMFDRQKRSGAQYEELLRYHVYLMIALPHRGTINIARCILEAAPLIKKHQFTLGMCSVTGNMPSLMNGGKDFCNWSRHDKLLYGIMTGPTEIVLQKVGCGVPEIGMGESAYEKNQLMDALSWLSAGIARAEIGGTIEMYFAGQGVMIRILLAQGKYEEALRLAAGLENRIKKQKAEHLLPNLRAVYIRITMYLGKETEKLKWLEKEAPDEVAQFKITDRYLYLTKARILISESEYQSALTLLDIINAYAVSYGRTYIMMETLLLRAITLYRMGMPEYRDVFAEVLKKAESHRFIRIIADEGAAVADLVKELELNSAYRKELKRAVERQMLLYPDYMRKIEPEKIELSEYELSVLRFVENGMSNTEIAEVMAISVHTVKYHLSNIYQKLHVKNRTMAVNMAKEYNLV